MPAWYEPVDMNKVLQEREAERRSVPYFGSDFYGTYDSPDTPQQQDERASWIGLMNEAARAGQTGDYLGQAWALSKAYGPALTVLPGSFGLAMRAANGFVEWSKLLEETRRAMEQEKLVQQANELTNSEPIVGFSDMGQYIPKSDGFYDSYLGYGFGSPNL